ncbi:related to Pre-rRNA-processing protein ESF2 [Cephalotrichum gorgonifer]|uniref:18S rRNA factor 2 n=1 Tax=Cephalotrichum gorgonifer TaxID=2041049 RepID=A0AAE8SVX4_9PEZI|nr:related to Pre-rRNA-processing protein ESF2 [Cephalotrichum gorgonifer]
MAPEKRNAFLDGDESDDDRSQGYNSDAEVRKGSRATKRRKIDESRDDDAASSDGEGSSAGDNNSDNDDPTQLDDENDKDDADDADAEPAKAAKKHKLPQVKTSDPLRNLVKKNLVQSEASIKKSGVLYVSRVPPFMKPHKLRTLLEPFGTINRTYLAPEDPTSHARRVRAGGNKKRLFTEAWVEFVDKRDAKKAHDLLNARTIGGKKGTYYRDDVWSLVYLKGFKWRDLTAQIEKENAERDARMRAEIRKATRENQEFARNVERAKELDGMKAKREKQGKAETVTGGEKPRIFKQTQRVQNGGANGEQFDNVKRVLSKIF